MTKVIPGKIEPAAYAPPVITTEIKAGTVDADTGLFAEATDKTFTCGDEVVFAVSYKADGLPVKDLPSLASQIRASPGAKPTAAISPRPSLPIASPSRRPPATR